jgi:hypothetical protein
VRACLLFCLLNKRFMESIFWLRELEDSFYSSEARRLLLVSWCMNIGLSRIAWLYEWSTHSETRSGRLRLCWQLLRCSERDSSLVWLLWSGVVPMSYGTSSLVDKWNTICSSDTFWYSIEPHPCLNALQTDMKHYEIFAKVIACSLSSKIPASSMALLSNDTPIDLHKTLSEWDNLSIRKGRVYEIHPSCLYGMTERGEKIDTLDELNTFTVFDSSYWRRVSKTYMNNSAWISDTTKEDFFDTHFPEDLPDEWSLKEKLLSHGPGVSGNFINWWIKWIRGNHDWIWGKTIDTIKEWIKTQPSTLYIDTLCKMYSDRKTKVIPKQRKVMVFN